MISFSALLALALAAQAPNARPVFETRVPAATKDKPQSKLWFAHDTWWTWLPDASGSAIWRRTSNGWQRQSHLDAALRDLPPQADVTNDTSGPCAVLVDPARLAVVCLQWNAGPSRYELRAEPVRFPMPGAAIETATIARDESGRLWIAYNSNRKMWVRASHPRSLANWTEPLPISQLPASDDDICTIVAMPGAVALLWSDQTHDAVYFRRHANADPPAQWSPAEIADQGGRTADDHISAAVAPDGSLYVATKNSVDQIGRPQLVLRVRHPSGKWSNFPYAILTSQLSPTRPIVQLAGSRLLLLHTLGRAGRKPAESYIALLSTPLTGIHLSGQPAVLIDAATAVNNVTGSKVPPPPGQAPIVLASDASGNIYEAVLP